MKADSKMTRTLAAIGQETSYADMAAATGIDPKLLSTNVAHLKARGYVERVNEGAPRCEVAYFRRTAAGDAALSDEPALGAVPVVVMTTVQRAIQRRPQLATVWGGA